MKEQPSIQDLVSDPLVQQLASKISEMGIDKKLGQSPGELIAQAMLDASKKLLPEIGGQPQPQPEKESREEDVISDVVVTCGDFTKFHNFVCLYALHLAYGEKLQIQPYAGASQKADLPEGKEVAQALFQIGLVGAYNPNNFVACVSVANATGPDLTTIAFDSLRADTVVHKKAEQGQPEVYSRRLMVAIPPNMAQYTKPQQLLQQTFYYLQSNAWMVDTIPASLPTPVTVGQDKDVRKAHFQKLLYTLDGLDIGEGYSALSPDAVKLLELIQKVELSIPVWDEFFLNFDQFGLK